MDSLEETFQVETPENVSFGYKVSGIGSRFLAALADTALIALIEGVVFGAALLALDILNIDLFGEFEASTWVIAILGFIAFLFYWGYYVFFEIMWNGQTPGKRWVGLRVIRADGLPITISESLTRNLLRVIDILPTAYGVAILTMFIDNKSRRLGDMAAGTLVVYDRKPISIEMLENGNKLPIQPDTSPTTLEDDFPLKNLTQNDIALLEDYLQRRFLLTNRYDMAQKMLHLIYSHSGAPVPNIQSYVDAENKLAAIAIAARKMSSEQKQQ